MSLKDRLSQIEKNISINPDLFKEKIDFDNMPEAELVSFVIRELNDEIKKLKNIADYHGIKIKDGESFAQALKVYQEKYCSDAGREIYTDKFIEVSGQLFNEYRDRIIF